MFVMTRVIYHQLSIVYSKNHNPQLIIITIVTIITSFLWIVNNVVNYFIMSRLRVTTNVVMYRNMIVIVSFKILGIWYYSTWVKLWMHEIYILHVMVKVLGNDILEKMKNVCLNLFIRIFLLMSYLHACHEQMVKMENTFVLNFQSSFTHKIFG